MPPRRENPRRDNVNIGAAELAQLIAQAVTQALQQAAQNQGNPGNNEEQQNQPDALAWFDRFVKQKPDSFHSAPQPIDAENWIVHLEKIFDALGCDDATKVRLAMYKLEGDAQRWWRGVKTIRGDAFVEALTWQGFTDLFYEQYFSKAEKDGYMREFNSIEQKHDESITEYLARFIRLAGFAGTSAGTAAQQAEKFKWGLKSSLRMSIISSRFQNVAEVADAAKDVEKERIDFRTNRSDSGRKRGRDDQQVTVHGRQGYGGQNSRYGQWRGQNQNRGGHTAHGQRQNQYSGQGQAQQGQTQQFQQQPRQWQNRQRGQGRYPAYGGNPNMIPVAPCATCGRHHPVRACYKQTGACFSCGSMDHRLKDSPRNNGDGGTGSGG